jgi:hypothetical protein
MREPPLFAVPFEELTADHVADFLAGAGDEGLTWECKGNLKDHAWVRAEHVYIPACGFANGYEPGILIIGAERKHRKGPWMFPGLTPPDEEPVVWINRAVRSLRPVPNYRISDIWKMPGDRIAAAVLVEPTPEPPCITRDGRMFQRTSSETVTVSDPQVLARLIDRGDLARKRAENLASTAAFEAPVHVTHMPHAPHAWPATHGTITLALCALGYEPDISGRLFTTSFRDLIDDSCNRLRTNLGAPQPAHTFVRTSQERVVSRTTPRFQHELSRDWGAICTWDGAVAITCALLATTHDNLRDEILAPAWKVGTELLHALKPQGRVHVAMRSEALMVNDHLSQGHLVRTWSDDGRFDPAALSPMIDELRRANGETVWTDKPQQ